MKPNRYTSSYAPDFQQRTSRHYRGGDAHLPPSPAEMEVIYGQEARIRTNLDMPWDLDLDEYMDEFSATITQRLLEMTAQAYTSPGLAESPFRRVGLALLDAVRAHLPKRARMQLFLADISKEKVCRFGLFSYPRGAEAALWNGPVSAIGKDLKFFEAPLSDTAETVAARALLLME